MRVTAGSSSSTKLLIVLDLQQLGGCSNTDVTVDQLTNGETGVQLSEGRSSTSCKQNNGYELQGQEMTTNKTKSSLQNSAKVKLTPGEKLALDSDSKYIVNERVTEKSNTMKVSRTK